ncbi:MAG TPA: carotenoid biosynthesis protein [Gemmatimonadaceae bacterium]|nr:carotenoid biosynthesis protein [Gemmatimonadaceae bacterium]
MERASRSLLAAHVVLILFSTYALTTFLAGTPPAWLGTEPAQTVYHYGWMLSGPTYVILGAAAIFLHAAQRFGQGKAVALLTAGFGISLASEILGTSTGLPFGPYSYTTLLGYRIAGLVPFPIPLSWFYMVYSSLALTGRILPVRNTERSRTAWALSAGAILTAWDVSMDPAMSSATTHWQWHTPGIFYGMPLSNWVGWFLTGSIVARAMLAIVQPRQVAERVSNSPLPAIVYAANGVLPIALCLRHGLWWAAIFGALAMGLPLLLFNRPKEVAPTVILGG